ncbi:MULTISPECIES: hypothetical protein [unclassified Chryseobacterium]|jgi:hypothetical protein|uniref:hypothetical protein n=1 Tax=unclassified Chryseobacterium TaxID=2593645 RepID=UPI000D394BB7|nr:MULTISPECIES: hypothetical protein [unclassified Chryseobacterium]PTT75608.1 hypothetical protein DBR25_07945 [Chryseobacterium sp. HMWF001]PVV61287.1 hypothetical protein DD829_02830 [Chryseobacterium sp. HMWF035]
MRYIRRFLIFISLVLFFRLFVQIFNEVDLIPNYTMTFVDEEISQVDHFQNLNESKEYSKSQIYKYQKINKERSDKANSQLIMIVVLVIIQLFFYFSNHRESPKQNFEFTD